MRMILLWATFVAASTLPSSNPLLQETVLEPASTFGDGMVLQREKPVPVWGKAAPHESVTVAFAGQSRVAQADREGQWKVVLDPLPPGGPHEMVVSTKGRSITLKDILVGDVWLAAGQSNMRWPVQKCLDAAQEVARANHSEIRLFTAPKGPWKKCSPEAASGFSGVAYFFGRELQGTLKVPVGLVEAARDGIPAECFMSKPTLQKRPDLLLTESVAGQKKSCPSCVYDAQLRPLLPMSLRGAIWYQGEANRHQPEPYRELFPLLIRSWREEWGQGEFPFLFVQLANTKDGRRIPGEKWALLREAQAMALALPRTGMAVAIDLGNGGIHPPNKQEVGRRLALTARAVAYGEDVVHAGPVYDSMSVEGDRIRVRFKSQGGGLVAKGGSLMGFLIAGEDGRFVRAEASVEGESVLVWAKGVAAPTAVRYLWTDNPQASLFSQEGLPAAPFRTDR